MRPQVSLLGILLVLGYDFGDFTESCSTTHAACGRCLPTSECWPDDETWNALNISVGGHLLLPHPSAAPCHHGLTADAVACADALLNWHDAFWRSDQPGAMQFPNVEFDGELACNLPSANKYAYTACYQGAVPAYAIRVSDASDVQAAIRFAIQHNLQLTIKSTGHDMMGRSTAPASLNLWMHHLKKIAFHDEFRPEGCSKDVEKVSAVTAEAGVQWNELYEAADERKLVVVGAMSGSVSTAGGYMQGGGHSPLSPLLGLAADNILELEVVKADGSLTIANACKNRDLFWALRGGGGSTYGVVMSATYRAYSALENAWGVHFSAKANSIYSFQSLVSTFVDLQALLSDSGFWAGYSYFGLTSITGVYLLPNATNGKEAALSAFEPLTTYANLHPDEVSLNLSIHGFPSFQAWRNFVLCKGGAVNQSNCTDRTGSYAVISSRLLPKSLLRNNSTEVSTAFVQILREYGVDQIIGHLVAGRAVAANADQWVDNAVNPAWRTALWHVILVSTWTSQEAAAYCAATEGDKRRLVTAANGLLRELTPDSGCYLNEADVNEPDWQNSFFGSNFARLEAIKKQVDPQGVFSCWRCVGSR